MMSEMEYRKGNYIARVAVIEWGKQLYKGLVLLRQHGEETNRTVLCASR